MSNSRIGKTSEVKLALNASDPAVPPGTVAVRKNTRL